MPQTQTPQGQLKYRDLLLWLTTLLNEDYPTLSILMGGDIQATPHQKHKSHYPPLGEFCDNKSLIHIGDPHTPTFTPTASPLDHLLPRLPSNTHSHYRLANTTTTNT